MRDIEVLGASLASVAKSTNSWDELRFRWRDSFYILSESLHVSDKSLVRRARSLDEGVPLIIKSAAPGLQSPKAVARLRREYQLVNTLDPQSARPILDFTQIAGQMSLVMEDHGALPLAHFCAANEPLEFGMALRLAIGLMDSLASIHQRGVIHKDINPANILVSKDLTGVMLIDFDIATSMSREQVTAGTLEDIEGTLAYVSPEQTGRTGQALDERSDLYSAGVTLYQLFTGSLPFSGNLALDLVYAHLALDPEPASHRHQGLPPKLDELLSRLLQKEQSRRYLSAVGVKNDLKQIEEYWRQDRPTSEITLGQKDLPLRLNVSQKMYGVSAEQEALLAEFEHVTHGGSALTLLAAPAGFGKTSLLSVMHKDVLRTRALIIQGKYDEMRRDVPYDAIIRAFRAVVQGLLALPEERLTQLRAELNRQLERSARVLVDVMPELAHIIGATEEVASLPPNETRFRFQQCFAGFVRALSHDGTPLVLFLDDLQWADHASFDLLFQFVKDPTRGRILVVLAYRDNEITPAHPLFVARQDWLSRAMRLSEIHLKPLDLDSLSAFCTDTLRLKPHASSELAQLMWQRTKGNPLFVHQLMRTMYKEECVRFDLKQGAWTYDVERIRRLPPTSQVTDLLALRLDDMAKETLALLGAASCFGMSFDLATLVNAAQMPMLEGVRYLTEAVAEGFVLPTSEAYRYIESLLADTPEDDAALQQEARQVQYQFAHDRIREACYGGMSVEQRTSLHLRIGRVLRGRVGSPLPTDLAMVVLGHLNHCTDLIKDDGERRDLARLNLMAGERAVKSSAWDSALALFGKGIEFLQNDAWENERDLTRNLHLGMASCALLTKDRERAEALFDLIIKHSENALEKAAISHQRCQLYIAVVENEKAIGAGLEALAQLGLRLHGNPSLAWILAKIISTRVQLRAFEKEHILELPEASDPGVELAQRIMMMITAPSLLVRPLFAAELACASVLHAMEHGLSPSAPHAFLTLACAINGATIDRGFKLWACEEVPKLLDVWQALLARWPDSPSLLQQQFAYTMICAHWRPAIKPIVQDLLGCFASFVAIGDYAYAQHTLACSMDLSFSIGENCFELVERYAKFLPYVESSDFQPFAKEWLTFYRSIEALAANKTVSELKLFTSSIDNKIQLDVPLALCMREMITGILHYLTADDEEALTAFERCAKVEIDRVFAGGLKVAIYYFFRGLAAARALSRPRLSGRAQHARSLRRCRKMLRIFSSMCPDNCLPLALVLEAATMIAKQGRSAPIMQRLRTAMAMAQERGFANIEAIAAEILAAYMSKVFDHSAAMGAWYQAYRAYERWGVVSKCTAIEELLAAQGLDVHGQRYGAHSLRSAQGSKASSSRAGMATLSKDQRGERQTLSTATLDGLSVALLDMPTLMRAAQALAGEIEIDQLKRRLLGLVCENAGATRALLVMFEIEAATGSMTPMLVAEASSKPALSVDVSVRRMLSQDGSLAVVQWVHRTGKRLILADIDQDVQWHQDQALKGHGARALFALPISTGGSIKGILYLENDQMAAAFKPERIALLSTLAGQIAISLENASLYGKLTASLAAEKTARLAEQNAHQEYVKAEAERRQLASSIEAASAVQVALLMRAPPHLAYHIAYVYRPAERAGGDWWGTYLDQERERLYLMLGDVTGHGIPSALVSAAAAGAAASSVHWAVANNLGLADALAHISHAVNEAVRSTGTPSQRLMTMSFVALDLASGLVHYLSAGHPQLLLLRQGRADFVPVAGGSPLGWSSVAQFGQVEMALRAGDQLLLYSDGLIENRDRHGLSLRRRGLVKLLANAEDPGTVKAIIETAMEQFVMDTDADDTAAICLKWQAC